MRDQDVGQIQPNIERQASKLQTYRRKTEFNAKWLRSFKITCFGVSGKEIRDVILNTNVGLI